VTVSLGDLTQIPISTRPTQGLPKLGDVSVTLYNQDLTNVVYASYQQWFTPGQGNSIPIQPLGSITISAAKAIYVGSLVSGILPLLVLPEGSNIQPSPAQIAAQINALGLMKDTTGQTINTTTGGTTTAVNAVPTGISNTGVPLLTKSTVIFNNLSHVITAPGGQWQAFLNTSMPKTAYEVFVTLGTMAADAQPWAQVQLFWKDSASGQQVAQQDYLLAVGTTTACQYHGVGPIHADQLSIFINNLGVASSLTAGLIVLNNSNTLLNEVWRSENMSNVNTQTNPSQYLPGNLLAMDQASVATGGNRTRLLPLYAGTPAINLRGNTASNTTDFELQIRVPSSLRAAMGFPQTTPEFFDFNSDSHGLIQQVVQMPRVMMEYFIINHNAAAEVITVNISAAV
jgi:hypothetical protein